MGEYRGTEGRHHADRVADAAPEGDLGTARPPSRRVEAAGVNLAQDLELVLGAELPATGSIHDLGVGHGLKLRLLG